MKKFLFTLMVLFALQTITLANKTINYKKINTQAKKEYLKPFRIGTNGINPFWNEYAKKFIYAPAFDFPERTGAKSYLFLLSDDNGHQWQMTAKSPKADLSPIWNDIPGGTDISLVVLAVKQDGHKDARPVGERKFMRDFPFHGPYNQPVCSYKEAALKAMIFVHRLKNIQHWKDHQEPNMGYFHNTYACKIMGATIRNECMVAKYFPEERETALRMARNVATFLKTISQPAGTPLAYFPPTYYKDLIASSRAENQNTTMSMEAISMAWGLLDLYNETKDRQYYDWALNIADTYQRLQRPDGSIPIKLVITTGEAVNEKNAMLYPLICYLKRLHDEYGVTKYDDMRLKGEKWMHEVAIRNFDMTGQFEDVTVLDIKPYANLTNCTAAPYADYLYCNPESNADDLMDADDLMRLSEDQFTFWEMKPGKDGILPHITPCVYEQYRYQMSVDNSACNVAGGFLAKYERTGDLLALAKAIALTNSITIVQNANTGQIPTTWVHYTDVNKGASFWLNCTVSSINMLLRMDEALKGKSKFRFYS